MAFRIDKKCGVVTIFLLACFLILGAHFSGFDFPGWRRFQPSRAQGDSAASRAQRDSAAFNVHNNDPAAAFNVHNTDPAAGFNVHNTDPAAAFNVHNNDPAAAPDNVPTPQSPSSTSSSSSPERCAPVPLKFPVQAPLFPCPWLPSSLPPSCRQRLQASLSCEPSRPPRMVFRWVSVDTPPAAYDYEDPCLARAVRELCYRDGPDLIPNLSHHVMFGGRPLVNYTFLGVVSSVRFLQPCMVMIHADVLPVGPYWDTLVRLIPHLIHVKRSPPKVIFGHKVKVIEHSSDIARLEAVRKFGGVYQDTDYILVNPFEDLRNHSMVMGKTIPNVNYCNCIFMGKPGASFLNAWYDSYLTFKDSVWGFHSTIMPYKIHHQRPDLEFHEVNTFVTPYFGNIKMLFYDHFLDWKRLHGIHLYTRFFMSYFKGPYYQRNSSLGQVSRHILFGDSKECFGSMQLSHDIARMNSRDFPP